MYFNHLVTEIIQRRFSCRSYLNQPLEVDIRQRMVEGITHLPAAPFGSSSRFDLIAADTSDARQLRELGTYGFIRGATAFVIGASQPAGKSLEDFGFQMEWIVLLATDLGLGNCWLGGSFTRSSFGRKIAATDGEIIPAVCALGYPARQPNLVDVTLRKGVAADRRLGWETLFFDGHFSAPLKPETAGNYAVALEMVRRAPSASNKQPWRVVKENNRWHFFLQRTPGYRQNWLVRLLGVADMQRIDLGIAMCHFELTAAETGLKGVWQDLPTAIALPGGLLEYVASWVAE